MRAVVKFGSDYVNIKADHLIREDSVIFVYSEDRLVGMFDIGAISAIYLSGGDKE